MAELYTNADQTTVAAGGYTPGSGVLNVANSDGDSGGFPTTAGTWRVTIYNHTTGEARVTLKVTGINSATQLAVLAEGPDVAAFENNIVRNVLTAGAVDQIKEDISNDVEAGLPAIVADIIDDLDVITDSDLDTVRTNIIRAGTYASIPGTHQTGDLYLQSDGPYQFRSNGSSWVPFLPSFGQVTLPASSGWSWVNQGGASVVTTNGSLQLLAPAVSGDNVRLYVRSALNSTFVVTMVCSGDIFMVDSATTGLMFREAATGKIAGVKLSTSSGSYSVRAIRWSSPTGGGSIIGTANPLLRFHKFIVLQMELTASNVIYRFAYDSRNTFFDLATEAKTASFTTAPDQYGLGVNTNNSTYPASMTAISVVET